MPLLRNKLQRPKALLCILRYGHHFFMNIDERQGLSIPSHYAVSHPHIIVCNIIFSDTETRLGIHNSRWLDFGVMKMESKSKTKKYFWKETVQHQNSEFTNCWLDKPLLPSEDVQVIKSVQFFLHQSGDSPPLSYLINVDTEFLWGNHQFYFRDWDPVRTDSGIVCVLTLLLAIKWVSDDNTRLGRPSRHNVTWRIGCNGIHNETRFS